MGRSILIVEDYPAAARRLAKLVRARLGEELGNLAIVGSLEEARSVFLSRAKEETFASG